MWGRSFVAVEELCVCQPPAGDAVRHRPVAQDWQVEGAAIEGDQHGRRLDPPQQPDDHLLLGHGPGVVGTPLHELPAAIDGLHDEVADGGDAVEVVLGEGVADRRLHGGDVVGRQLERTGDGGVVGDGLEIEDKRAHKVFLGYDGDGNGGSGAAAGRRPAQPAWGGCGIAAGPWGRCRPLRRLRRPG